MPAAHSPRYEWRVDGAVRVGFWDLGVNQDGSRPGAWTEVEGISNNPPENHGCCQQKTITGARILLNTKAIFASWYVPPVQFNIHNLYDHELGHTLGLGHTNYQTQVMYWQASNLIGPRNGDKYGVQCIYDLVNCNTPA